MRRPARYKGEPQMCDMADRTRQVTYFLVNRHEIEDSSPWQWGFRYPGQQRIPQGNSQIGLRPF